MMVRISASYEPTNRYVTCGDEYRKISKWSKINSKEELIDHPTYSSFIEALEDVKLLSSKFIAFRGRTKKDVEEPNSLDMGPPYSKDTKAGRYNVKGESVFYLCNSELGIKKELLLRDNKIWIQKFIIPTDRLKIADFTNLEPTCLVSAIMWHCELAGSDGYCTQLFSQTISKILKKSDFDGALVHGVRGNTNELYNNLFILNPLDRWINWIDPKTQPILIDINTSPNNT